MSRRLTSDESQRVFRALLDALANPGRPVPVGVALDGVVPVALPALALADIEVGVAVVGGEFDGRVEAFAADLIRVTGARLTADPSLADMVVVLGGAGTPSDQQRLRHAVGTLRCGDAFHPELGARLVLGCQHAVAADLHVPSTVLASSRIWITGAGATPGRLVDVVGVDACLFEALQQLNRGFPAGVDTWLVADDGNVVGLPRSCRIEVVAQVVGR